MKRHFTVTAASKIDRLLVHLTNFQAGYDPDESVCFFFKFDKDRYYKEECVSDSGDRRYYLDNDEDCRTLIQLIRSGNFDALAEDILTLGYGTGDIAGLCLSGEGYSNPGEPPEAPLSAAPAEYSDVANLVSANLPKIKAAIERYCADLDNYQVFED